MTTFTIPPRAGKMQRYASAYRAAQRRRLMMYLSDALGWRRIIWLDGDIMLGGK